MKRTKEQSITFFKYTKRSENEAYFTKEKDALFCIEWAKKRSFPKNGWIEPFAGNGSFSKFLPGVPAYDINPLEKNIEKKDSFSISWEGRSALTNIPFNLKKQCVKKGLEEAEFFWTIGPFGLLSLKECWIDEIVLFKYGNWTIPRSYLEFITPDNRQKIIYCAFFKVCRLNFKREIKSSKEEWACGATNRIYLDERFYIRENDDSIRQPICNITNKYKFGKIERL